MAQEKLNKRMLSILKVLKKTYPEAKCSLNYDSPFQLLIATILSAQCTDDRVNQVTPVLFRRYPTALEMSRATLGEIEKIIRSTGFFRSKALSIQNVSQTLLEKYRGAVPRELDLLVEMRGVGRKTANVVLGNAFGIPGLVVDTHVGRISRRMGFTKAKDPVKVEEDMRGIVPKKEWVIYSHLLIAHGRAICTARKAMCEKCPLNEVCEKVL